MSGHPFVRPGQVTADLPAPDTCVRCGLPETAHVSPELTARRIAADAVLADFNRTLRERWGHPIDWQNAALRLAQHLQQVLQALDGGQVRAGTGVAPDGTGTLSPADVTTVVGALADACAYRAERGWTDQIPAYRSLSRQLGDDR